MGMSPSLKKEKLSEIIILSARNKKAGLLEEEQTDSLAPP